MVSERSPQAMSKVAPPSKLANFVVKPFVQNVNRFPGQGVVYAATLCGWCVLYGASFAFFAPALMLLFAVPPVVLGLLVLWAMPELGNAPTRSLDAAFFIFLVLWLVWPNYLALSLPGLPWITMARVTSLPMTFLLLCCLASSEEFRTHIAQLMRGTPVVYRALGVLVFLQFISIFVSDNKAASADKFVIAQVTWTTSYVVGAYVFSRRHHAEIFGALICAVAVILALIGLLEYKLGHLPWVGHIPSFLQIQDPTVARILTGTTRGAGGHRVQATFSTSLGFGEYCGPIAFPYLMFFFFNGNRLYIRLLALIAMPVVLLSIILSQARVGTIGVVVALLLYPLIIVFRWRKKHPQSLIANAAFFMAPLASALGVALGLLIPAVRLRVSGGGATQTSSLARIAQLQMGLPKVLSHPWGYGIGRGAETLGYTNAEGFLTIDTYSLRLALECGVLGMCMYYLVFIGALAHAGSSMRLSIPSERNVKLLVPAFIALLSLLIVRSVIAQEDNQPIAFALLGMVSALVSRKGGEFAGTPDVQ